MEIIWYFGDDSSYDLITEEKLEYIPYSLDQQQQQQSRSIG